MAFGSTSCVECGSRQLCPCQLLSLNFPHWRLQVGVCGGQNHMCLWWLGLCLAPWASLHPGHFSISVSQVSLCRCILGISESVSWASLHLTILGICISACRHLCIVRHLPMPGVEAARQESWGAAPPAQLWCRRVSARAAESSSSPMLSLLSKSLAASFS